jgi:hypothetical protein
MEGGKSTGEWKGRKRKQNLARASCMDGLVLGPSIVFNRVGFVCYTTIGETMLRMQGVRRGVRARERESIMICHELNLCLVVMIVIVIVTLNVTRTFSQFCVRTNAQIIHHVLPPH